MPVQHLSKEIEVTLSEGEVRMPQRFKLGRDEHQVAEVLASWRDQAFSGPSRRGWRGGSERQYYRLRTPEGDTFEIYVETPAGRKGRARWYASRRISAEPAAATAETPPAEEAPPESSPAP